MKIRIALLIGGLVAGLALSDAPTGKAQAAARPLGANLERFDYPYPVKWYEATSQGRAVRMAYMDVPPTGAPNGAVVVLLHGKNFCGATWADTAKALSAGGFRVLIPDQIGFCKSSKPSGYQYSFQALAALTHGLLAHAGAQRVVLVGHSTGGMLAIRYALAYPAEVARLVLVNPLGLNDTLADGAPYADVGMLRQEEDKTDAASIKAYELKNYYHGDWRPAYDRWLEMLAGEYQDDGGIVRDAQARLSDMIETQPVTGELPRVQPPVSLLIGQLDRTAFRANTAPADRQAQIRAVPQAAEDAVKRFPSARLVRLPGLGHAPQVEDPPGFNAALLREIAP
jgi:pimeloyl-ACP methyl ester carboxylesterase